MIIEGKIWIISLGMLLILAPALAEENVSPGDSAEVWVATNCCLDYQEVCLDITCNKTCLDWGTRCQADCGQYCSWGCEEWGYGCYDCCEVLTDVECQTDEEGLFGCLNRFSATNCTECCDEYECVGGWNQTCINRCIQWCDDICLLEGESCKCTSRAWKCNRWGPCYVPEERVTGSLNATGAEEPEAVSEVAEQPSETPNNTSISEPEAIQMTSVVPNNSSVSEPEAVLTNGEVSEGIVVG